MISNKSDESKVGENLSFRRSARATALFFLVIFLVICVYSSIHIFIFRWLLLGLGLKSPLHVQILRIAIIALACSFPAARFIAKARINRFSIALDWIGSVWLGLGFYLLVTGVPGFAAMKALRVLEFHFAMSRMIVSYPLLCLAVGASCYALYRATRTVSVTSIEARMKNLPRELDGMTVVQVSDLHLGVVIGQRRARRMVECINALSPDLVLITGDFVDEAPGLIGGIFSEFKKLRARFGVLASCGNHEFFHGVDEVIKSAADANVRFLRNEKTIVAGKIVVYGIDDPVVGRMGGKVVPFEEVIGPEAREMPAILMYHRPSKLRKAAALGIDLMLSGHTHNGQIWPFGYIVRMFFPRLTGEFIEGNCKLYCSRGLGTWGPPMRFKSPPEVVQITLRLKS